MPSPSVPDLTRLIELARAADGQPPFSDQALVDLRTGERDILVLGAATAIIANSPSSEVEFVVEPDARGNGQGTAMLEVLQSTLAGGFLVWSHGDHPAARSLAASHGLVAERQLLQLRADVSPIASEEFERFIPGTDDAAWVALNAQAFAFHAEQGSVSLADLHELMQEPWFAADDFLVARDGGDLIGYCWLKVEDGIGEIYVIGIDPGHQGEGLGRRLMNSAITHLASRGIHTAALYVEADNHPARALYASMGFSTWSSDVQYRAPAVTS